jgi:large subunit ribosomal protein L31
MKAAIHPRYAPVVITCMGCGAKIETRSTKGKDFSIDVCSSCHSFFTGRQKFMDSAGRVERFQKKWGKTGALPRKRGAAGREKEPAPATASPQQAGKDAAAAPDKRAAKDAAATKDTTAAPQAVVPATVPAAPPSAAAQPAQAPEQKMETPSAEVQEEEQTPPAGADVASAEAA